MVHSTNDVSHIRQFVKRYFINFLDTGLQDLINISLIRSLLCLQIGECVVCPKINLHAKFLEKVKQIDIRQYVKLFDFFEKFGM